jgi:hypothetical protein
MSVVRLRLAAFVALLALAAGCRRVASPKPEPPPYREGPTTLHLVLGESEPLLHAPTRAELEHFPVLGDSQKANLTVPVDWNQDPYGSRSFRLFLQAWRFMTPLLVGFEKTGDDALFTAALKIADDWVTKYEKPTKTANEFVWYDMAVSSRAAILAYLIRKGTQRGILPPERAKALLAAARAHGAWLANSRHYEERHNHGLFADTGLLMLCRQLDALKECQSWQQTARQRFSNTLRQTVARSGVHLEHSTSYHFTVIDLLERALRADDQLDVAETRDRMRQVAPWLVQPDGRLPQLGDTSDSSAPEWAAKAAAGLDGARFFRDAGYFVVRRGPSYLLVTAGYHSKVHKHQDDLSFVLYEQRRVLVDPGFAGYNASRERDFLRSARAHNVLIVDGRYAQPKKACGSSLLSSAEAGGWYAVWARDPTVPQGVLHERVWLYEPGHALLVVDEVTTEDDASHEHTRYFHFAPDIQVSANAHRVEFRTDGLAGSLWEASQTRVITESITGRARPMQGFVCPESALVPSPVIELTSEGKNALLLSVVELGQPKARSTASIARGGNGALKLRLGKTTFTVSRENESLDLKVAPAADGN